MRESAVNFCKRLNIEFFDELVPYYEKGVKLKGELGLSIFDKERLISLNEKYSFFKHGLDPVLEAREHIIKNEDIVLFNYIMIEIIKDGKNTNKILPAPLGTSPETDFCNTYAVLYFVESAIEILKKRSLSDEIIGDSLSGIESEMLAYHDMHSRYGTRDYQDWYLYFIRGEIIRIGRLQYQFTTLSSPIRIFERDGDVVIMMDKVDMHKKGMLFGSLGQDDEAGRYYAEVKTDGNRITGYAANKYGEVEPVPVTIEGYSEPLKLGDNIAAIHITNGEPFGFDSVKESMKMAEIILREHYSDMNIKCFFGHSWVFEKRLRDIMGRDTNLTLLADYFVCYPAKAGMHGVFEYVFSVPQDTPYESLPENTSMQRGIKKYLLDGNIFYEKMAIRLIK